MAEDASPKKLSRQSSTVSAYSFKSETAAAKPEDALNQNPHALESRTFKLGNSVHSTLYEKRLLPVLHQPSRASYNNITQLDPKQIQSDLNTLLQVLEQSEHSEQHLIPGEDEYYHFFDVNLYAKHIKTIRSLLDDKGHIPKAKLTQFSQAAVKLSPILKILTTQLNLKRLPSVMDNITNHLNRALTLKVKTSLQNIGFSPFRTSKILPNENRLSIREVAVEYNNSTINYIANDHSCHKGSLRLINQDCHPEKIQAGATINLLIHETFEATLAEEDWVHPNSPQAQLVAERFGGQTTGLRWSGENHKQAKKATAKALAELLKQYCEKQIRINLFAHSHAGNVVNLALQTLNKLNKQQPEEDTKLYQINFLAMLGTPDEHTLPHEDIKTLTGYYVNVVCGGDPAFKLRGANVSLPDSGETSRNKTSYEYAGNVVDKNADFILTLVDAHLDQLHDFVVFNQLRDPNLS
jgi:hypothetical protein